MVEVNAFARALLTPRSTIVLCRSIYRILKIRTTQRVVSIAWVSAREIQRLHRRYRGKNRPTNVLSFVYQCAGACVEGEIILCSQIIRKEAREIGTPIQAYAIRLLVHGLLHLEGYKHDSAKKREKMERFEYKILQKLGIDPNIFFKLCYEP